MLSLNGHRTRSRHRVSGKPACPPAEVHVLKVSVQENFAQLWLQVKMRSHRAHCSADLLFDKPLTKLPWPEMAHTRKCEERNKILSGWLPLFSCAATTSDVGS